MFFCFISQNLISVLNYLDELFLVSKKLKTFNLFTGFFDFAPTVATTGSLPYATRWICYPSKSFVNVYVDEVFWMLSLRLAQTQSP